MIHAVGPVWNGGSSNEDEFLASAYRHSLQLAVQHEVSSIAFPNISTGIYGFPKERAAQIALREVAAFFEAQSPELEVTFVCFDEENHRIYSRLFREGPAE